ncbi:MAG TPA: copper chaperone PCu(A)C [Gemmatimonadales bacterium]|nr:copper chaperone PCu(A)C [Gemmatimonadales bacterium]
MTVRAGVVLSCLALLTACARQPAARAHIGQLEIRDAYALAPITVASGAAYLRIFNHGSSPDTLVEISSSIAGSAMVHGSMTGAGMSAMQLSIAPGQTVVLEPGGRHLMLMDLTRLPRAGEVLPITLRFAQAGTVELQLPVRDYGQ